MAKWLAVLFFAALLVATPAEILKLKIESVYCIPPAPCYKVTADINASASGQLALYAMVNGQWQYVKTLCYFSSSTTCQGNFELKPEYEALGFSLWTDRWVQSVDIYGVNAVCTMAYKCPEIDKVEVSDGRVYVFIKSPSQRMRVTLDIGGVRVEKEVEQPFATACTTLAVGFGPYDLPQGTCGRVSVYGDCGMIERQVCTPGVTTTTVTVTTTPCPTVATTVTMTTTVTSTVTTTSTAYVPTTATVTLSITITREVTSPVIVTSPTVITVPTAVTQTTTERLVVKEADAALLAAVAVAALAVGVLIGRAKRA